MAISTDKLKLRVETGISNPDEFLAQDNLFDFAIAETEGMILNKDLADAFVMDIAYYRFLLLADVAPKESDENNYKLALNMLKNAPTISIDEETGESTAAPMVRVSTRDSDYN